MTLPIESILGVNQLTGLVADPMGGVPMPNLPAGFFTTFRNVSGMKSSYFKTQNVRTVAQLTDPNAPSKRVGSPAGSEVPIQLFHSRENQFHNAVALQKLMSPSSQIEQDLAIEEIGRKTAELNRRQANLLITAVNTVLRNGKIWFDAEGNLLPSTSSSAITVDYSVPTDNTANKNIGDWETAGTNILLQLETELQRLNQLTGLRYTNIIYGKAIPQRLALNTAFASFINSAPVLAQSFAQNTVPADFGNMGLRWYKGSEMWYVDSAGTTRNWVGDDAIVILPDPSPEWYEIQRGTYMIPGNSVGDVYADAQSAVRSLREVTGRFSYATISHDPVGVTQIVGDTWLPVVKVPGAIRYVADVTASPT